MDEKRLYLTELLDRIGLYFEFTRHNNILAEQMYKRAIYEGESLWYPSYGWSLQAMTHYSSLLRSTGRKKEADEISSRLSASAPIETTSKERMCASFGMGKARPQELRQ